MYSLATMSSNISIFNRIYLNRNNCFNINDTEVGSNTVWSGNVSNDQIVEIINFPLPPFTFFTNWNETHFQLCGPLLLIAEYFAKFSKTK